jgi:hypothetical protein
MTAANYELTLASLGYGAGDIGTPGSGATGFLPTVSAVPLPAAAWLFASGLLAMLSTVRRRPAVASNAAKARGAAAGRAGLKAAATCAAGMPS